GRDQYALVMVLDGNPEPPAFDLAGGDQLPDHRIDDLTGDRETDADRGAGRRHDDRTDPDHLTIHIEHWPAGIARIDRRVELKKIVERSRAEITPRGGYD